MSSPVFDLTARVGCHLVYETFQPTPVLLLLRPRRDGLQEVRDERLTFSPSAAVSDFTDINGNIATRFTLQPGQTVIHHDAIVGIPSVYDNFNHQPFWIAANELPSDVLRYTLPSRYCDSDKLLLFAAQQFAGIINGLDRVVAICNWVHFNIEYRFGSGRPDISASEIIGRRYGVCRDFAHSAIALCRALNLPARYVTGHLPDIGYQDPGTPMDFHAYFEVYLGHQWCTFDARFNVPRIGRIKIAHGLDAVDVAFGTLFGVAELVGFDVWSYQVNPGVVTLDQPVDLSKRLDGTPLIRFS